MRTEAVGNYYLSINESITKIKGDLFPAFVRKWSSHKCQAEEQCKKTITFDGLWKVNRSKCCYDKLYMQTDFGDVEIGCTDTPVRGPYF